VLADPLRQGLEVGLAGDVELDDRRLARQALGDAGGEARRAPEGGQDDLRALLGGDAGHGVRDRLVGQHAGDEQGLALEQGSRILQVVGEGGLHARGVVQNTPPSGSSSRDASGRSEQSSRAARRGAAGRPPGDHERRRRDAPSTDRSDSGRSSPRGTGRPAG
jgi:hypothetical protein